MKRAIDSGDEDEVMRLLDADPTLLDVAIAYRPLNDGLTPLIYAACEGQLRMVMLLIGRGANIHATSSRWGKTALHYGARSGREEVVAYLIRSGAQTAQLDTHGYTPLMQASMKSHDRVVALLLEHMGGQGLEIRNQYGRTALHEAARWAHEDVMARLLRHGARADTNDQSGTSALRKAVSRGYLGVVKLLLDHLGPQALQEKDEEGRSLLHDAIDGRREDMVVFLLGRGLRPDTADNEGVTALMHGASSDSIGVLQRLLEQTGGQGLDGRDANEGRTALHHAADSNGRENVRALLLAGADPTIMDNEGRTPGLEAEAHGRPQSLAVFDWWDGELERGFLLCRARALHDTYTAHQQASTRSVLACLEARVGTGLALPRVEVVAGQANGAAGAAKRKAHEQEERHAMVEWLVGELNGELFTELMQGFHAPRNQG